jgi:CrcB protein
VVLGGGLVGSAARIGMSHWMPTAPGEFPIAILVVNLIGSFLLGLYLARRERGISGAWSVQLWAIGALGSFTTFSTFSLDVVQLVQAQRPIAAGAYLVASVVGGLALALIGQGAGRTIP